MDTRCSFDEMLDYFIASGFLSVKQKKTKKGSKLKQQTKRISDGLEEKKTHLIRRVLETLGWEKTSSLYLKALERAKEGDLKTKDGLRERTKGGVFFYLLRTDPDVTKEQINTIFEQEEKLKKKRKKNKKRQKQRQNKAINKVSEGITGLSLTEPDSPQPVNSQEVPLAIVSGIGQIHIEDAKVETVKTPSNQLEEVEEGEILDDDEPGAFPNAKEESCS